MIRYRFLALLAAVAALASCEENAVQQIAGPAPSAGIKFFNFGVGSPGVNFYANDTKVTAISSATGVESTTGVIFPNAAAGGLYNGIAPGQYAFSGRIAATTDKDLPISNVAMTIADGKRYSFYQSGFYDATGKTIDAFIVEDPFIENFDWTVAYVRFVHAIANADPMTLYITPDSGGTEVAIGGEVAYKSAGAFTVVPNGLYDLATRYTDSTTNKITRANVSFSAGRVYTITARGDITVTSTSATTRPFLDNTANR